MTHIKWPNEPNWQSEPNWQNEPDWQNEAMRQSALLHSAMMGGVNAEARANQLELERDALLRVVTDNHVALTRAEAAEAKLAKAVATLTALADMKTSGDGKGAVAMAWHAREVLNKIKGMDK